MAALSGLPQLRTLRIGFRWLAGHDIQPLQLPRLEGLTIVLRMTDSFDRHTVDLSWLLQQDYNNLNVVLSSHGMATRPKLHTQMVAQLQQLRVRCLCLAHGCPGDVQRVRAAYTGCSCFKLVCEGPMGVLHALPVAERVVVILDPRSYGYKELFRVMEKCFVGSHNSCFAWDMG